MGSYARAISIFESLPDDQRQLVAYTLGGVAADTGQFCRCAVGVLIPRTPQEISHENWIAARVRDPVVTKRLRELQMTERAAYALERINDLTLTSGNQEGRRKRFEVVLAWMKKQEAEGTFPAPSEL